MEFLDSKCIESFMIEDYHLDIATEGIGDFFRNFGQRLIGVFKFFTNMIGTFISFLKRLANKKAAPTNSSSSASTKENKPFEPKKPKSAPSDEEINKVANAIADKTRSAMKVRKRNVMVTLKYATERTYTVVSALNYCTARLKDITEWNQKSDDMSAYFISKHMTISDVMEELESISIELKNNLDEFFFSPKENSNETLRDCIDTLEKAKKMCLNSIEDLKTEDRFAKSIFGDGSKYPELGKIYKAIGNLTGDASKCCSYIAEIISNAAKVPLYNSANTARDAGVPEDKILKTKKDVDNYFTK